jgi:hypothetical protein
MRKMRDLWLGVVPKALVANESAFDRHLDALAWSTDVEPDSPLAARLAVVHQWPDAAAAVGLAEAVAVREGVPAGSAAVSDAGLGWLAVAAVGGDGPAAELLTAAHLRVLRTWLAADGGRNNPALLRTVERIARSTGFARAVRAFTQAARANNADIAALDALIAEIDPGGGLDHFLAPDVSCADLPTEEPPGPSAAPAIEAPDRIAFARRLLTYRLPWLTSAIDALCPPNVDPNGPLPPRPVLLAAAADRGQTDVVTALSLLMDIAYAAEAAPGLTRPERALRAAVQATGRSGPLMLRLDAVDDLDSGQAARLAEALRAEGFLPTRDDQARPAMARGLVMLAETCERVPDVLRRNARVVPVEAPGPAHAAHVAELLGTAVAIERRLAGAWELPLSDRTWADLHDRIAAGTSLDEIRTRIERS